MEIPSGLGWWRDERGGAEWLDRLPELVRACAEEWGLVVGVPFEDAHISLVLPVQLGDGSVAVLKVNFPEPESEHEPDALAHWGGLGAVRLLERDDDRRALLVERCRPGRRLWEEPEDDATLIAADVLDHLWQVPEPVTLFRRLTDEAMRWAEELPAAWELAGKPFEHALIEEATAFLHEAVRDAGDPVLLHQDLHGGNILHSERGWLAIDPKPLLGEREFDTASLLRDRRDELARDPDSRVRVQRRLDLLSERLDLDRERVRGWGLAHALAWGHERDRFLEEHVLAARAIASAATG